MAEDPMKPKVLIVDDEPVNIKMLGELLKSNYRVVIAKNGADALDRSRAEEPPELILLDIMMPDINGYEVCRRLKAEEQTRGIPVIFVTAMADGEDETKGFEAGAVDYITKPFCPAVVQARVRTHLELKRYRDRLEELVVQRTRQLQESLEEYEKLFHYPQKNK